MPKRIISLLVSLVLLLGVFACVPFTAFANDGLTYLYNKPFENNGYWEGSVNNIIDGYFSNGTSNNGNHQYLVTKDTLSLGDEFEVNVTSVINNQNSDDTKYSLFGVGDFAIIINPDRYADAPNNCPQFYNYAVLYNFDKTVAYSTSASSYDAYIAASTIIASDVEIKSEAGGYISTLPLSIALKDGILTFTINGNVVAIVTAEDMAALDDSFAGFNFNDIKIGMSLKQRYKVYAHGAYFKDLSIAAIVTPAIVDGIINALPETVTLADEYLVQNATDIYNGLSDADKAQVTATDKLNAARVDIVEAYITAIPDGVTSADFAQVDEALAKFNAIPAELQAEVGNANKLAIAVGQMGVIDIIEGIANFGEVTYTSLYAYNDLGKKINALTQDELAFVYNYADYVAIGTALTELKAELTAEQIIADIVALPAVEFTPSNAAAYNTQIQNIDLDYVDAINEIRAKINLYGNRDDVVNYTIFFQKELALIDAMEAFNELADTNLVIGTHKKNYTEGVAGEYITFPANTVIYAGDTVYFNGLHGCSGTAPNGTYKYSTLYNMVYRYNDGSESGSFQPVNGKTLLTDLKVGNYKVYHKSWSTSFDTYLLVEFNVVEKPTYKYGLFDVATMLDHTVMSYDEVKYADKTEVAQLWNQYDEMDVFVIDDVHTIRNLVDADRYFEDVENGIIIEEGAQLTIGDINNDGTINSADVLLVKQYLVGVNELASAQIRAANVNQSIDGKISSGDFLLLANYVLGRAEL